MLSERLLNLRQYLSWLISALADLHLDANAASLKASPYYTKQFLHRILRDVIMAQSASCKSVPHPGREYLAKLSSHLHTLACVAWKYCDRSDEIKCVRICWIIAPEQITVKKSTL